MRGRRFGSRSRVALYLAHGGSCSLCGIPLGPGWHADHVVPWSHGGPTDVINGQALCPGCNLKKGSHHMIAPDNSGRYGSFIPFPWQDELLDVSARKIASGEKDVVSAPFCGGGKTKASHLVLNNAWLAGQIGGVLVLVPRINLAQDHETTWREFRKTIPGRTMGAILHTTNETPLIRSPGQFGVAATYASLARYPQLYSDFVRDHRAAVVYDEAQILGLDSDSGDGTKAARIIESGLLDLARFNLIMTGTPDRSDGLRLLRGRYSPPDRDGKIHLLADVSASYLAGVRGRYLRGLEATLCDATAWRQYVDDHIEEVILSQASGGAQEIFVNPGFWRPMVDLAVDNVRDVMTVHPRFCGLVAAFNQNHARAIKAYIEQRHRGIRVGIAISDEPGSLDALKDCKAGHFDVLVTVRMAYIGYNNPWIRVICCLSGYREVGFLDQLLGRALRRIWELPFEQQLARWIAPYDRLMASWVERRRADSQEGMRPFVAAVPGTQPGPPVVISTIISAQMTDVSALALDPADDLDPRTRSVIEGHARTAGIQGIETTRLAVFAGLMNPGSDPSNRGAATPPTAPVNPVPVQPPGMTDLEFRTKLRSKIKEYADQCDGIMMGRDPSHDYGDTYKKIHRVFAIASVKTQSKEKLAAILTWLRDTHLPSITVPARSS